MTARDLSANGVSQGDLLGDRGAGLSACGQYRYTLWRCWDDALPQVLWVMLNPSTADALADDPTIRKCIGFARRWGAGSIRVVNLYAWRATDKRELARVHGPVGEFPWQPTCRHPTNRNDAEIVSAAVQADRIVAAWGAWPGPIPGRPRRVLEDLLRPHRPVEALRLTKDGHPWHPLYVSYETEPVAYV